MKMKKFFYLRRTYYVDNWFSANIFRFLISSMNIFVFIVNLIFCERVYITCRHLHIYLLNKLVGSWSYIIILDFHHNYAFSFWEFGFELLAFLYSILRPFEKPFFNFEGTGYKWERQWRETLVENVKIGANSRFSKVKKGNVYYKKKKILL